MDFNYNLLQAYTQLGRFPHTAIEQLTYIGRTLDILYGNNMVPYELKIVEYLTKHAAKYSKQKLQQGDLLIQVRKF